MIRVMPAIYMNEESVITVPATVTTIDLARALGVMATMLGQDVRCSNPLVKDVLAQEFPKIKGNP